MPSRNLCSHLASVICGTRKRPTQIASGNLEEIDERTAVLLVDTPIRTRTKVRISCQPHELKGVVQSCIFDNPLGFILNVRLDPTSRWSEQWFTPHHFLSLCANLRTKAMDLEPASGS